MSPTVFLLSVFYVLLWRAKETPSRFLHFNYHLFEKKKCRTYERHFFCLCIYSGMGQLYRKKLFHILNINFMSFVDLIRELLCPLSFKSFLLKLIWLYFYQASQACAIPFQRMRFFYDSQLFILRFLVISVVF